MARLSQFRGGGRLPEEPRSPPLIEAHPIPQHMRGRFKADDREVSAMRGARQADLLVGGR